MLRLGLFSEGNLGGFSGIPRAVEAALQRRDDLSLVPLEADRVTQPITGRISARIFRIGGLGSYLWEKSPSRCAQLGIQLDREAEAHRVDAVLLFGSEIAAGSRSQVPLFAYGDSIFGTRLDLYDDQSRKKIRARSIREGVAMQQSALDRLSTMFLSSRFAIDRAVAELGYRVDEDRISIVGIGANLETDETPSYSRSADTLRLLWIGSEWFRKGGDRSLLILEELRRRGVAAELHMVGERPAGELPTSVFHHGRIDSTDSSGRRSLAALFAGAHFNLLPTRADLTPVAIHEAAGFGTPTIATPVGAIGEMITSGENGLIAEFSPAAWCDLLQGSLQDGSRDRMSENAFRRFRNEGRWDVVVGRMIEQMCTPAERRPAASLDRSTLCAS